MKQKKFDKKVKGKWWNFLSLDPPQSKGIVAFLSGGGAGVSFPQGRKVGLNFGLSGLVCEAWLGPQSTTFLKAIVSTGVIFVQLCDRMRWWDGVAGWAISQVLGVACRV